MDSASVVIIAGAVVVSTAMLLTTGMFCLNTLRLAMDRRPVEEVERFLPAGEERLSEAALHAELREVAGRVRTIQRLLQDVEPVTAAVRSV